MTNPPTIASESCSDLSCYCFLCRIFLLLISTASMVCKLSYVNPSFQPLLAWQPWCKLCMEYKSSRTPPNGVVTVDSDFDRTGRGGGREDDTSGGLWTLATFEELVKEQESGLQGHGFATGEEASDSHQEEASQPLPTP